MGSQFHYELRDDKDRPINPLEYKNYTILDTILPVVLGLHYKEIPQIQLAVQTQAKNLKLQRFLITFYF